jgi:hypothetical protein
MSGGRRSRVRARSTSTLRSFRSRAISPPASRVTSASRSWPARRADTRKATITLDEARLDRIRAGRHLSRAARERLSIPAAYTTIAVMTPIVSQVFTPGSQPSLLAASPAVPTAVITRTRRTR